MLKTIHCLTVMTALAGLALTGCATTKRVLTNTLWGDEGKNHIVYLSYWEGTCRHKSLGGCSRGDGHVKYCTAQTDNSLKCENATELDALLAK